MVSPPSEPHSEKAHPNSPPQINLAFKAKGPDQDPGTTQPEGNSTHLTFFPRGGAHVPGPPPPRSANEEVTEREMKVCKFKQKKSQLQTLSRLSSRRGETFTFYQRYEHILFFKK